MTSVPSWREAWTAALYGPGGFSVSGRGPRTDFSTAATRGPRLAVALAELLQRLPLGGKYDVTDLGAGDGRLLADLRATLPPEVAARGRFTAVELAPRPDDLDPAITWTATLPPATAGLLIAHEWLDTVPCDLVECQADGSLHELLVEGSRCAAGTSTEWMHAWWPLAPGQRAEVGLTRDLAWREATATLERGLAVAVDYGHLVHARPAGSTLTGYARGREVAPVADGSCDLTAHVAFDSLAEPGDVIVTQREALQSLGVSARLPAPDGDPAGYLRGLATAAEERVLLSESSFYWLLHTAPGLDAATLLTCQ